MRILDAGEFGNSPERGGIEDGRVDWFTLPFRVPSTLTYVVFDISE